MAVETRILLKILPNMRVVPVDAVIREPQGIPTVSYTHLDVYKRQFQAGINQKGGEQRNQQRETHMMQAVAPVSYTHLDVYKRQDGCSGLLNDSFERFIETLNDGRPALSGGEA